MPPESTVRGWVVDDLNGFAAQYSRSRDLGLDVIADEMLDIADDGTNDYVEREGKKGTFIALDKEAVMRSRLRFEARQWYLSKMAPKRYAQRTMQEITGKDGAPLNPTAVSDTQLAAALNALMQGPPVEKQPLDDGDDIDDLV